MYRQLFSFVCICAQMFTRNSIHLCTNVRKLFLGGIILNLEEKEQMRKEIEEELKQQYRDRYYKPDSAVRNKHEARGGSQSYRLRRIHIFLDILEAHRDTLKKQLSTPELQAVNPIVVGELKAIEMVIDQYINSFELNHIPTSDNE